MLIKLAVIEKEIKILDGLMKVLGHRYDDSDNSKLLKLFNSWINYQTAGEFFHQRTNIPEGLTESIVAKDIPNVYRKIKVIRSLAGKSKFDCYKTDTKQFIEVKGCSITNDLTSWSPKPFFDFFCFVDFSTLDGKYKIFQININSEELKNENISTSETFQDQINKKRRPRFSVYEKFINKSYRCTGKPIVEGDLNK